MPYTWICDECEEEIQNEEPYVDVMKLINGRSHVKGVKVHVRCLGDVVE